MPSIVEDLDSDKGDELVHDITELGMTVGDVGVVFSVRQEATIEAVVPSQCLVLQKVDFDSIAKEFPDSVDTMKRNIKMRLRAMNEEDPLLQKLDEQNQDRSHRHISKLCDMLFAAGSGEVNIVREALDSGGIDVNEMDYEKRSCLHISAGAGHVAVVELLLRYNAAVNRKDAYGKTPLDNAVVNDHAAVIKVLLDAKAKLDLNEADSASALCDRVREAKFVAIQTLLSCGVNVNAADYDKRMALHLAASEGNKKMV